MGLPSSSNKDIATCVYGTYWHCQFKYFGDITDTMVTSDSVNRENVGEISGVLSWQSRKSRICKSVYGDRKKEL